VSQGEFEDLNEGVYREEQEQEKERRKEDPGQDLLRIIQDKIHPRKEVVFDREEEKRSFYRFIHFG
jgi:hypothetical protein